MNTWASERLFTMCHRRREVDPNRAMELKRQINTTDKQIDKLVYDLYGLTEDEIKSLRVNRLLE